MKTNPLLKTAVVAVVALAHAGLIALSWQAAKTADIIESGTLTMVDLGSLGDSGEPAAESAPAQSAPPPPPPPVQQKQPEVVKPKKSRRQSRLNLLNSQKFKLWFAMTNLRILCSLKRLNRPNPNPLSRLNP